MKRIPMVCRVLSFNEAPAIPPGKTALAKEGGAMTPEASMRPRRFRRGKPLIHAYCALRRTPLQ